MNMMCSRESMRLSVVTFITALALMYCTAAASQAANDGMEIAETGFISADFRPFLHVNVCGIKTTYIADTGSAYSVIDTELAGSLEIEVDNTYDLDAPWSEPLEVRYGGGETRNVRFLILDLSEVREASGDPIYGILGMSVFDKQVLQLDFDASAVRLLSRPPMKSSDTVLSLLREDNLTASVEMMVGEHNVRVKIDSGSDHAVQLSAIHFAAISKSLDVTPRVQPQGFIGAAGTTLGWRYLFAPVFFAEHRINDVIVSRASRERSPDVLGKMFMRRFNWNLDFAEGRSSITRSRFFEAPDSDVFGMVVSTKNDSVVVEYVIANSVADVAGIRPADVITSVKVGESHPTSGKEIYRTLRFPTSSAITVLLLRQGVEKTLVLESMREIKGPAAQN